MKCLILAGGQGERLWPLSRKNYPKQFIQIQKNHSLFQETIARNIPFCDEFIIITSLEYRYLVENQMKAFQGTPYRCIYEEEPKKTMAAILLACMGLQLSEFIFVVASDHLIDSHETAGEDRGYKDSIIQAKEYARNGAIVLFGILETKEDSRYGYMMDLDPTGCVGTFVEKPQEPLEKAPVYRNLGMALFQNGIFQNDLAAQNPDMLDCCTSVYERRVQQGRHTVYPADIQKELFPISFERGYLEKTKRIRMVHTHFSWNDVVGMEDLSQTEFCSEGVNILNNCIDSAIVNNSPRQAVVVNGLNDVMVVNTVDAVYIGRQGDSFGVKGILRDYPQLLPYAEKGTVSYRSWGYYELLLEEQDYRVRRVCLLPGKTIYGHKHLHRSENWNIVKGEVLVTMEGRKEKLANEGSIFIPRDSEHQISNIGEETAVFIETATGEFQTDEDMVSRATEDVYESQLGYTYAPMVKLLPAYKGSVWGGTKLRDRYGMNCDYDVIAESWLLSAHPAGQSIVASGRHKGKLFSEYLTAIGKNALGWKSRPLQNFPLLVKFIDARENLSVQVHPDDDYALEHENEYGKNELWYVMDAEPGAGLYVGFNREVTREEVEKRVQDHSITEILNFFTTKPGDVFYIPAGTVHAIGAGNLICEIQQSSNSTYRLYDYGRKDRLGRSRQLHLQKALDVLDCRKYTSDQVKTEKTDQGVILARCKYFEVKIYEVAGEIQIQLESSKFNSVVCINGSATLKVKEFILSIKAGDSVFIPATDGCLEILGNASLVMSYI